MALHVFYGYAKLSKIIKKPALTVIFENGNNNSERNLKRVKSWMHIIYTRKQTAKEASDAQYNNRMFTVFDYFIDEKPVNGDIDYLLDYNFQADCNHVSIKEREEIKRKLRFAYPRIYNRDPIISNGQLRLNFEFI